MPVPIPTPIYRIVHVDNLDIFLRRDGLHAPNFTPKDGMPYKTVHNIDIQKERHARPVACGPCGVLHDYVSFYFGPRSPMLFQLHTGRVEGYTEGQESIVYLVSAAQSVVSAEIGFVFSDGHGIAWFTTWFDDLSNLDRVDWEAVNARYWKDTVDDMDRQRRKQAEFLIHRFCPWPLVHEIGVLNSTMKERVGTLLADHPSKRHPKISIRREWYY